MGWVGNGPNQFYCNAWKCVKDAGTFIKSKGLNANGNFKKQMQKCSIEHHMNPNDPVDPVAFCSHTTCRFHEITDTSGTEHKTIQVRADHKEENGGFHKCGVAKHEWARSMVDGVRRPMCDCLCHGNRRQDADNFQRTMHEISPLMGKEQKYCNPKLPLVEDFARCFSNAESGASCCSQEGSTCYRNGANYYGQCRPSPNANWSVNKAYPQPPSRTVEGDHDSTQDANTFDTDNNANNFYSQHDNVESNEANQAGQSRDDTTVTQYNENDQSYEKERVSHYHEDTAN